MNLDQKLMCMRDDKQNGSGNTLSLYAHPDEVGYDLIT